MRILDRILYCLTVLTPCLTIYCCFMSGDSLLGIPLLILSFISSRLLVYLMPHRFRREQNFTILNVLLIWPPLAVQINLWLEAIVLTFPATENCLRIIQRCINLPTTLMHNSLGNTITGISVMVIPYFVLFVVYVICRKREQRKEQTS